MCVCVCGGGGGGGGGGYTIQSLCRGTGFFKNVLLNHILFAISHCMHTLHGDTSISLVNGNCPGCPPSVGSTATIAPQLDPYSVFTYCK